MIDLVGAQMPEFNWQRAFQLTKHVDANPRVGEITDTAAANDNSFALKREGRARNIFEETFKSESRVVQRELRFIERIAAADANRFASVLSLVGSQRGDHAALEIEVDSPGHFRSGN